MRFSLGSNGQDVQKIQVRLISKGFGPLALDGVFGTQTQKAVRSFQASSGTLAADGIVGDQTWSALMGDAPLSAIPVTAPPPANAAVSLKKVSLSVGVLPSGVDVSSYQPGVDFGALAVEGIDFVFIKASENAKDPTFDAHWAGAKKAGMIRGAYHFFHPAKDPVAQAELFCGAMGALGPGDLPPVMDWEVTDGAPSAADFKAGMAFLEKVEALAGKTPIIYGGAYFFLALASGAGNSLTSGIRALSRHPLWHAQYTDGTVLTIADIWDKPAFWQSSSTGRLAGSPGPQDLDVFNGTMADLRAFAGLSASRPAVKPAIVPKRAPSVADA